MHRVGSFRFWYQDEQWEWSDEVAALHGYRPGEVTPTTELMIWHKHPDDRVRFKAMVAEMLTNHAPFSSRHRIVDTRGRIHPVSVIAHTIRDNAGRPVGTEGFYLDLTDSVQASVKEHLDDQVESFRSSRASIEQAKGMLMLIYGVSAERAFDVLRWRSQNDNIKVKDLAEAILHDARAHLEVSDDVRRKFDDILLMATSPPTV
nr:PAS and ANTAR domain-containing protein [Gordonia insulae]